MKTIYLGQNKLGPEGGKAIAKMLEFNTTLTVLGLCDNKLGPEGAKAIAESLIGNTTLTSLDLEQNDLDAAAGVAIAKALEGNTELTISFPRKYHYSHHKAAHSHVKSSTITGLSHIISLNPSRPFTASRSAVSASLPRLLLPR